MYVSRDATGVRTTLPIVKGAFVVDADLPVGDIRKIKVCVKC